MSLCSHRGMVDYDPATDEYYCTNCGDVVPKPDEQPLEDEDDE